VVKADGLASPPYPYVERP